MPNDTDSFSPGQRWISNTEPELGLGIVLERDGRNVTLAFPAAEEERAYAVDNAPLSRLRYREGDRLLHADGRELTVESLSSQHHCVIYDTRDDAGDLHVVPEIQLSAHIQLGTPRARLVAGQLESSQRFQLRRDSHSYNGLLARSPVQGLLGARAQLLPHQIHIASEVAGRFAPRVLLADEVGLGKTIEAGLIVHQQLLCGLAERVLITVPDSLVHQWLVEMLRRFNLRFTVLDEARCEALPEENPFDSSQLILCSRDWLCDDELRLAQALECDWDLLVVDEAHHLEWRPQQASPAYLAIEALSNKTAGLLLLTATPEQLGLAGHFARLRLLDPQRYPDLESFVEAQQGFKPVGELIHRLQEHGVEALLAQPQQLKTLAELLGQAAVDELSESSDSDALCRELLDFHGTGRVLFRNTRHSVGGFPARKLHRHPLPGEAPAGSGNGGCITIEDLQSPAQWLGEGWLQSDGRVTWLLEWLKEHRKEKILLIGATADTADALEQFLSLRNGVRCSAFHEHMTLLERDRAAAWFADPEQGAQVLICSEIGSEGRNFQFATHLVLFDLPRHPDLLEQRIGRLDRIGRVGTVHLHAPYYPDSAGERLLDWYELGLDAFSAPFPAGEALRNEFRDELEQSLSGALTEDQRSELIRRTRESVQQARQDLRQGRDRLVELHSHHPERAEKLIETIEKTEDRDSLEHYMGRVFDDFGIEQEPHSHEALVLRPGTELEQAFPHVPDEGTTVTFDRQTALSREELQFLSWEHPMVSGIMERILSTEFGTTCLITLPLKALPAGTLLIEALYRPSVAAQKNLRCFRYLPGECLRVCLDSDGRDLSKALKSEHFDRLGRKVPKRTAREMIRTARSVLEKSLDQSQATADARAAAIASEARQLAESISGAELQRLEKLADLNPAVREDELQKARDHHHQLLAALEQTTLVLDSLRVALVTHK